MTEQFGVKSYQIWQLILGDFPTAILESHLKKINIKCESIPVYQKVGVS